MHLRWKLCACVGAALICDAASASINEPRAQALKPIETGFVFSDWDLRNAVKIARDASGGAPVNDDLTIKEGGRR